MAGLAGQLACITPKASNKIWSEDQNRGNWEKKDMRIIKTGIKEM
jgi:hypothetical protein